MDLPVVLVVIPNWNLKKDLAECLDSVLAADYPNLRIMVVDNASTDGSQDFVRSQYPAIHLLEIKENLGYAGALNAGIRAGQSYNPAYIFALNNDTIVPPETIHQLVKVMEEDPACGIAAPKVLYHENPQVTFSLGDRTFPYLPVPVRYGVKGKDLPATDHVLAFDYLFGCALLIRSKMIFDIGLFDTAYFMFYEDADYCRRAVDAGWRLLRVGYARIYHKASLSVKKERLTMTYLRARNRSRFYRRYRHGPHPYLTFAALLLGSGWRVVNYIARGQVQNIKPYIKGAWQGLREKLPEPEGTQL